MNDHEVFRLDALSAPMYALEPRPRYTDESDPLVRAVRSAIDALKALNEKAGSLDHTMIGERRREALSGDHAALLLRAQRARAALEAAQRKLAESVAKLDRPAPVTSPADVALDVELRAFYRACSAEERTRLNKAMAAGEQPDLLAALARFGPGADAERARQQFRALSRAANPDRVTEIDRQSEANDWAAVALRQVGEALDAATLRGVIAPTAAVVA